MARPITDRAAVVPIRDERYATLWEMAGPETGLVSISAAFVAVDPGKTSPLHHHEQTEEIYMVTSGTGVMYLGDERREVTAGDCISISTGIVHAIGNPGPEVLEMWVATSPPYCEKDDFEQDG